jgi:hypothetical protein
LNFDPFGGAKARLLRRDKEASLRVNPEQARAFRPGRVEGLIFELYELSSSFFSERSFSCPPFLSPFLMPEIKSHKIRMTTPISKKFGVPILLNKSEKYSSGSIPLIFGLILSK